MAQSPVAHDKPQPKQKPKPVHHLDPEFSKFLQEEHHKLGEVQHEITLAAKDFSKVIDFFRPKPVVGFFLGSHTIPERYHEVGKRMQAYSRALQDANSGKNVDVHAEKEKLKKAVHRLESVFFECEAVFKKAHHAAHQARQKMG